MLILLVHGAVLLENVLNLASKTIKGQVDDETNERLRIWTTVGKDKPFGEYCINGARAGMEFGLSNGADLNLINNFDWLQEQFND